jgi:hypothetical protein
LATPFLRVSVEYPNIFGENQAAVALRGADEQVALVIDTQRA